MKILILEDMVHRINSFKKELQDHELHFATTIQKAIELEKEFGPFDIYYLDHDLDGKIFISSHKENTGYQFVKYLCNNIKPLHRKSTVVIHSMNPVGAHNMYVVLKKLNMFRVRRYPFPILFGILKRGELY